MTTVSLGLVAAWGGVFWVVMWGLEVELATSATAAAASAGRLDPGEELVEIRRPELLESLLLYVGHPWHEGVPPVPSHSPSPGQVCGSGAGAVEAGVADHSLPGERCCSGVGTVELEFGAAGWDEGWGERSGRMVCFVGRGIPRWVRWYSPQALQMGIPMVVRRHSGVWVVWHATHRIAPKTATTLGSTPWLSWSWAIWDARGALVVGGVIFD